MNFPWRVTTRTQLDRYEEAIFLLQARLGVIDAEWYAACPASGCCGCGTVLADVSTPPAENYPLGEAYCWSCVKRLDITDSTPLPRCTGAFDE